MKNDRLYQAWIVMLAEDDMGNDFEKEPSFILSPDKMIIKKDLFDKLSSEAREVVMTIAKPSDEFNKFVMVPRTGKFKHRNGDRTYFIKSYFRKRWQSRTKVSNAFKEIKIFVSEIYL